MKSSEPKNKRNKNETIREDIYPVIDNDLARDNLENDIPAADLQDLDKNNYNQKTKAARSGGFYLLLGSYSLPVTSSILRRTPLSPITVGSLPSHLLHFMYST